MEKYTISINVADGSAIIKNNETGKQVSGKVGKYHRGTEVKYEVRFDKDKVGCDNNGIVQVPKINGKFQRIFNTNLTKKQSAQLEETDFN
jgi:hypothetical protein